METRHYGHLENHIKEFFRQLGLEVAVEPRGSRGPDLESAFPNRNGAPPFVGEIKHDAELQRDLRSAFWSNWNNPNLAFGGKTKGCILREAESLDRAVEGLSAPALGFVATVMGQLKHYVRSAGLDEGWLVVENHSRWNLPLREALDSLRRWGHLAAFSVVSDENGIGYARIRFGRGQGT